MPHVVVEGPIDPARVHRELAPFEIRADGAVLKVRETFLARSGRTLLVDAVAVEGAPAAAGRSRRFLIEIDHHGGQITVRLFPPTDPEKTAGVKRLVAEVGWRVLALDGALKVGRTNLAADLAAAAAAAGAAGSRR